MREEFDVVIVGGGVLGCAAAYRLADRLDVLLLEREQLAASASGAGAGVFSPTVFLEREPAVARYCNEFVRTFDGEHGFFFTEHPRLELIKDAENVPKAQERAGQLADDGFPVEFLDSTAVDKRYPSISTEGIAGAIEFRDTGYLDTSAFTTALAGAARERGATIRTGVTVTSVLTENGRAFGVDTTRGRVKADTVVAAAGWANPTLLPDVVSVPVRAYRTQCVTVRLDGDATNVPIWRRTDRGMYARPWDAEHLVVGGGSGALEASASKRPDPWFRKTVRNVLPDVLCDGSSATVRSGWTGVAGMVEDGWPIASRTEAVDGLIVVQGAVMGIMAAPAVSKAVEVLVRGGDCPFDPSAFSMTRFDDLTAEFEIHSVSSGHYNH